MHPFIPVLSPSFLYHPYIPSFKSKDFSFTCNNIEPSRSTRIDSSMYRKRERRKVIIFQIVFAKGAHYALGELSTSGYDVLGLDWTIDPRDVR